MRASWIAGAAGTLATASAIAAAPATLPGPAFPRYASAAEVVAACDAGLAGANERVRALEQRPPGPGWLGAFDDITAYVNDASGPVSLVMNVHPDKSVRDAAQACLLRWSEFDSTLGQNETLYRAALKVEPRDAIDRAYASDVIDEFEDYGVGLAPEARQRAKALSDRIAALGQQFGSRIRDADVELAFAPSELAGVPEAVWQGKPRDAEGRVLLGLESPVYLPVLEYARSAGVRERIWRAKQNEAGAENLELLKELGQLRREYARLFGAASFAEFQLHRRMAGSTATTDRFLGDVKAAVVDRELRDLEELRQAKARHLGAPLAETRLDRWDVAFYAERGRLERYAVDQEAFRAYFPPEESMQFVLRIAEKLFGVRHTQVPAALWHADAKAYAVTEVVSGKPVATLYVDLYPREGKYKHAAVWSFRRGSTRNQRLPQSALVVNLDRKGLTLAELETLLHEVGHALHNNLSATRYVSQAGTSVQRDFVEAPSQMLEDWVFDKRVLKLFAEVCPTCTPVPDAMIEQALAARDYGQGLRTARQHLYAAYDLAFYAADAPDPMALWQQMEGATPLGYVAGTMFPANFGHIASGYAAGYYGYLWSRVIALDLRTAFNKDRLDPAVGARYRATVLANGRQFPPSRLLRDFLGRETDSRAFFEDLAR